MTNPDMSSTNHPSDETLAAFVDDRLDIQSRKVVIEHIATCDDCRAAWETISEFTVESKDIPDNVTRGNFHRGRWYSLSAVAAAIALGFLLWPFAQTYLNRDALIKASASRKDRPSLARLSGEHPYRAAKTTFRGNEEKPYEERMAGVYSAALDIERAAEMRRSPENLRQLAAVQLLTEKWDYAVASAEEAIRMETDSQDVAAAINRSTNAPLLIEVSAVYYARASRSGNPSPDYARAAESAKRAWGLSKSPAALWNYALALEGLGLHEDARDAWREYLKIDPDSEWATEANQRLADLDEQARGVWEPRLLSHLRRFLLDGAETNVRAFVARYPKESRQYGEEELLAEWGRRPSEQAFEALRLLGDVLARRGDRLLRDTVAAIEAAPPPQRQALANAHAKYFEARVGSSSQPTRALAIYDDIFRTFSDADSPFGALVQVRRAGCLYRTGAYHDALRVIEATLEPAEHLAARGYRAVAAQAEWMHGLVNAELAFPDAALRSYQRSLLWFRQLQERPSEADALIRMVFAMEMMAEGQPAFLYRLQALSLAAESPNSVDRVSLLTAAMFGFSAAGYANTAGTVVDRLVITALRSGKPDALCTAFLWRSFYHAENFDRASALRDYDRASSSCAAIDDAQLRGRIRESQSFVAGRLAPQSELTLPRLNEAIEFADRTGSRFRAALLFTQRSQLFLQQRDTEAARADARRAVTEVAHQLSSVTRPHARAPILDAARDVFAQHIQCELAAGDIDAAFQAAEWQRTAAVFGAKSDLPGPSVDQIRAALRPDAAVISFHIGADHTIIFALDRGGVVAREARITRDALSWNVAALRLAVERNDSPEISKRAGTLYEVLLQPIDSMIGGKRVLVIVPDGALAALPFALLSDREGRLLVDRFTLTVLSSAARVLRSPHVPDNGSRRKTVIVAGAPRAGGRDLALVHLDREISQIASLYPGVQILKNEQATPEAFLAASTTADTLHYAGHAKTNERQPYLSALVLPAGKDGHPRFLYAHQIAAKDWSGVRFAVLAGCSTGRRDAIARPFGSLTDTLLHAGVGTVVGTLWDVEDEMSRTASVRIHAAVRAGKTPAEAVRQVQLEMRNSTTPGIRAPRAWAAWTAMGGHNGRAESHTEGRNR